MNHIYRISGIYIYFSLIKIYQLKLLTDVSKKILLILKKHVIFCYFFYFIAYPMLIIYSSNCNYKINLLIFLFTT